MQFFFFFALLILAEECFSNTILLKSLVAVDQPIVPQSFLGSYYTCSCKI